jgi:hypothetical protein
MLVIQTAAQMEAVKLVEDATVILSVTLWVTAAPIFQRHVPGYYTLPLEKPHKYYTIHIARVFFLFFRNTPNEFNTSRPQLVDTTTGSRPSHCEVKQRSGTVTVSIREVISWILVAILLSLLIVVITVMAIKARKRTAINRNQPDISQYCKMEGSPCYEFRQITQ